MIRTLSTAQELQAALRLLYERGGTLTVRDRWSGEWCLTSADDPAIVPVFVDQPERLFLRFGQTVVAIDVIADVEYSAPQQQTPA